MTFSSPTPPSSAVACRRRCAAHRHLSPASSLSCGPAPAEGFLRRASSRRLVPSWDRIDALSNLDLDDPSFFDHAVPLVSRHGLLLVRLGLSGRSTDDPNHTSDDDELLAVCNLLTGTVHVLPRLKHGSAAHGHHMTGYAILTSTADYSSSDDDSFKVLAIGISQSTRQYRLRTFSSSGGEPGWNTRCGIVDGGGRIDSPFMQHNAVVCGGMARWLFQGKSAGYLYYDVSAFYTLGVSAESGDVSFTKLPVRGYQLMYDFKFEESYFSVDTEERPVLIYPQRQNLQLNILTWYYHNNTMMFPDAQVLMLEPPYPRNNEIGVVYTCLGQNSGTLLVKDNHRRVYAADIKTGVMHEVTGKWPRTCNLRRSKTVPVEMDWPTLFLSRLRVAT